MLTALELLQNEKDRLLDQLFVTLQDRDKAITKSKELKEQVESIDQAIEVLSRD
jgi:hypothetical protein